MNRRDATYCRTAVALTTVALVCAAARRQVDTSLRLKTVSGLLLTGVSLVSTIAEYHYVLTLVRLLASAVQTEALARHPIVLLGAACFVVGAFPDLLLGSALWVQFCTATGCP